MTLKRVGVILGVRLDSGRSSVNPFSRVCGERERSGRSERERGGSRTVPKLAGDSETGIKYEI